MNTRKIAVATVLACGVVLSGTVSAAGPGDWTGSYLGGHLGYGMDSGVVVDFGNNPSSSFDMTGYTIGLQGGHNWAVGGIVAGVELDASYADINGDALCPNPTWTCGAKLDQLFSVRGRVGMPINNFLLYGTLGLASGQVRAVDGPTGGVEYPESKRNNGWVAGIGGEMAFNKNLSGRLELQYVDLGNNTYTIDPPPGVPVSVETKLTTLRIGANWKF